MKCPHCGSGFSGEELLANNVFLAGRSASPGLLSSKGLVLPHYVWVCPSCDKVLAITACDIANEPTF